MSGDDKENAVKRFTQVRIDEAARILYETYHANGYSPRWDSTAPNRPQWRRAATALLEAFENGCV